MISLRFFLKTFSFIILSVVLASSIPISADAASASQVTLNFMCPCGTCNEALSTCECPQSDGFRSQIAGMVGQGYTEEQIIQDFTNRFGPGVLVTNAAMAPNANGSGFDKKTFGFILLLASFTLAAFGLGRYMKPAPSPAPQRDKRQNRPKTQALSRSTGKPGKEDRYRKRYREGVDDDLLDD